MIIPALEYRRYLQRPRTIAARKAKLASLAIKTSTTEDEILASYESGEDLLDPSIFWREDLQAFAKENKIERDPLMVAFIARSKPKDAWA